mmetsp:Transcript_24984/g.50144  ORF Transcript_24984/g.50144 Transcript_24984/m.50144 type:complete len:289 (+) Transcript_24984:102-968(+)
MDTAESGERRNRKQTAFFEVATKTESKPVVLAEGTGIKLADNEYFCNELGKMKADSDLCKALHQLLFNTAGKKTEIKKNLRSFSGFPSQEVRDDKKLKVLDKKKVWTTTALKGALGMIGLEKGGDREVLVNRLIDYLAEPSSTKKPRDSSKKRKASSKGAKKGSKKARSGPKKAPSAYILYCNSQRAIVRELQPELTMVEQTKTMAASWNALSEKEKEPWLEQAKQAKMALAVAAAAQDAGEDIDFGSDDEDEDGDADEDGDDEDNEAVVDDGAEDDFKALEDSGDEE